MSPKRSITANCPSSSQHQDARMDIIDCDSDGDDDLPSSLPKVEGCSGSQTATPSQPQPSAASMLIEAAQRQARLTAGLKRERASEDGVIVGRSASMSEVVSHAFDVEKDKLLSALKAHSATFGSPMSSSLSPRPPSSRQPGSSGTSGSGLQQALAASSAATLSSILPSGGGGGATSLSSSNVVDASSGISELNRIFGRDDEEYAGVFTPTPRPLNPVEVMLSRSTKTNEISDKLRADTERKGRLQERGLTIWTLFEKCTTTTTTTPSSSSSSQHPPGRASIEDRGSRFEAFVTFGIKSMQDVADVLTEVRSDARIAAATHPSMYACRVPTPQFGGVEFGMGMVVGGKVSIRPTLAPGGNFVEMGDDDGEEHAASKIMTLLRRTAHATAHAQTNTFTNNGGGVLVVVCRWYGGKLLGPVRFQHITSISERCMRQVLAKQVYK